MDSKYGPIVIVAPIATNHEANDNLFAFYVDRNGNAHILRQNDRFIGPALVQVHKSVKVY